MNILARSIICDRLVIHALAEVVRLLAITSDNGQRVVEVRQVAAQWMLSWIWTPLKERAILSKPLRLAAASCSAPLTCTSTSQTIPILTSSLGGVGPTRLRVGIAKRHQSHHRCSTYRLSHCGPATAEAQARLEVAMLSVMQSTKSCCRSFVTLRLISCLYRLALMVLPETTEMHR